MTIAAFFSVPTLHHYQAQLYKQKNSWPAPTYPCFSKTIVPLTLCSPSSTPASVISPSSDELIVPGQPEYATNQSGCKACGREEMEKGCNGEGRVQGGIATVPGFGWWPIKAYRPCPGFVASGGRYRRQGQSMDEVVSGRAKTPSPGRTTVSDSNSKSSKKKGRSEES